MYTLPKIERFNQIKKVIIEIRMVATFLTRTSRFKKRSPISQLVFELSSLGRWHSRNKFFYGDFVEQKKGNIGGRLCHYGLVKFSRAHLSHRLILIYFTTMPHPHTLTHSCSKTIMNINCQYVHMCMGSAPL